MLRTLLGTAAGAVVSVTVCLCAARADDPETTLLPPLEAARTMQVPDGFRVTLFAGEPDVKQPIGFCLDDRGRLWVAEAYNYPHHGTRAGDRIVILEDADGDGSFDNRTVFYDGLNYVSGIEVGFGGAWVVSPPYFYFIPDADYDDVPDGPPLVLLDGFGNHANSHNMANGLAWGPDGWLYGTHGRTNWSLIGKPGAPEEDRVRFDGGVYRYHPVRHVWEPFADGMTNPWGIDWDDYGQAFACNCVDPHLYHIIQGAHYEPWRNRESSRYAYQRIATIADHLHFVSRSKVTDGIGTPEEDAAGGGHAHCGTLVYLGDSFPEQYRNTVFMHNIHGRRINNDVLKRAGSGYVASHGRDFMRSRDPWYVGVTLQSGPDGAVYTSDWSDTGECHHTQNTQRGTGRIFKITYGPSRAPAVDLRRLSDRELLDLQTHRNDWYVRHARRLLEERAASGAPMEEIAAELRRRLAAHPPPDRALRLLWALHVIGQADQELLVNLLSDESECLRAWSIRLLTEIQPAPDTVLAHFVGLADSDPSPFVVLHLASALQRVDLARRWSLAEALVGRAEFAADANIPLMIWYGIEPLAVANPEQFVGLAEQTGIPLLRRHAARRIVELPDKDKALRLLVGALASSPRAEPQRDLLDGILTGLAGVRQLEMPATWPAVNSRLQKSDDPQVRRESQRLALIFGDPVAQKSLIAKARDASATVAERQWAIEALVAQRVGGVDAELLKLLRDPPVQRAAIRGLAAYSHPGTVAVMLAAYPQADVPTRQDILQTLAARTPWARALLDAVDRGQVPRSDLTAFTARQIHNLGDEELSRRIEQLWGRVRQTPAERLRLIAAFKEQLTPESLHAANRGQGRAVFAKNCANCHRLFDSGTAIGPDLTGAQRTSVDYLLLNLVDPSASISKDFQLQLVVTADGRVVTGLVVSESDQAVTIQTPNEKVVVPVSEIDERATMDVSMMPEGLLQRLSPEELRNLFAYLTGPEQVPLPAEAETSH